MITSHDVAKRAGVSQATVSRALRDQRGVSAKTRARVRTAARELGYIASYTGRALATRRTRKIAVVSAALSNPFYPALIDPLQHALSKHDLQTVLLTDSDDQPVEGSSLTDGSFDGVVLTTCSTSSPLPAELAARGIPFVIANRAVDDTAADMCVVDNRLGGQLVADLLVELGHQRIAAIMGPESTSTGRERWQGFAERLDHLGLPTPQCPLVRGAFAPETGRQGLEALLAGESVAPTAVFCGNDVIALGVLDAAMNLGVRVPEDLTVVGFDDIPLASWGRFSLTTVHVDLTEMAETVADSLVSRLEDPECAVRRIVLTPHLVSRGTHAPSKTRLTGHSRSPGGSPPDARMLRSWMSSVSTVARAVNATLPPDAILTMVAKQACDLIGFDYCAIMLPDEREQNLVVEGFNGLSSEYVGLVSDEQALQIRPASTELDSPAARAYREHRTIAVPDTRTATVYGRLRNLAPAQGYRSLLAAPLKQAGAVIGLLVGYLAEPHQFSALEVELAELLGEQTATVLQTAQLRRKQQEIINDLSALNDQMRQARRQLDWAEEQHHRLMQLVLDDAGLDGLAQALAGILEASITVEGEEGKVLASAFHSTYAPPPPSPSSPAADRPGGPADIVTSTATTWMTPVVLNGKSVGRLWVSGLDSAPTPLERRAIERFALVVGVELLQRRHLVEVRERLSGDLLADLLRPDGLTQPDAIVDRAAALGVDLTGRHTVALVRSDSQRHSDARLVSYCRDYLPTHAASLVGWHHDCVVMFIPASIEPLSALQRLYRAITARAPRDETIIVLGPEVGDVAAYLSAYRIAEGVARLRAGSGQALIDARAMGATALLLGQHTPPAELRQFSERRLAGLLEGRSDRHREMVETLRVWLSVGCSASKTAEKMLIHINTVAYRLKRISTILESDLSRFDVRLDLQLALLIRDIADLSYAKSIDSSA